MKKIGLFLILSVFLHLSLPCSAQNTEITDRIDELLIQRSRLDLILHFGDENLTYFDEEKYFEEYQTTLYRVDPRDYANIAAVKEDLLQTYTTEYTKKLMQDPYFRFVDIDGELWMRGGFGGKSPYYIGLTREYVSISEDEVVIHATEEEGALEETGYPNQDHYYRVYKMIFRKEDGEWKIHDDYIPVSDTMYLYRDGEWKLHYHVVYDNPDTSDTFLPFALLGMTFAAAAGMLCLKKRK